MTYINFRIFLLLALAVSFFSCSLDKRFLKPYQFPANFSGINMIDPETNDTTVFTVYGENKQPLFLKNRKDTIQFDFTTESVLIQSESGYKINGWFMKQKGDAPKITLIHFHGNAGFLLSQNQAIAPLIKEGFQIFTFDYSGFGFSEGKATRDNVLFDGLAALEYVKSRPDVMNTKVVIYGQSLGGHLAAVVGQKKEGLINGLVIEGAFSSHKDIAAHRAGTAGRILTKEKYSAKEALKAFNKPVLIIHSTEDKVIPFYMGKELYASANEPKAFYEIKQCHICGPKFYADSISAKIKKMVE